MKKRKIIEKIKEKDRDSHLRALAELERKFIDEAAARSHSAARSG
jgi:hypothetical protein